MRLKTLTCVRAMAIVVALVPCVCSAVLAPPEVTLKNVQTVLDGPDSDNGTLTGALGVTGAGQAQYLVPLAVPPGAGGMVPSIAAAYGSGGPSGHLGVGWTLVGVSAIARCAPNLVQDGTRSNLRATSQDKLCLDGNRLVPVAGEYWKVGTLYKTESESFLKIEADSSGFVTTSRQGVRSYYGQNQNSVRSKSGLAEALSWHLSRVEDRNGNYYTVAYESDPADGDIGPSKISYTGNTNAGVLASIDLTFDYEDRTDVTHAYLAGAALRIAKRLSRITASHAIAGSYFYKFDYTQSISSGSSLLSAITRCRTDTECLSPVRFSYGDKPSTVSANWTKLGPDTWPPEFVAKACKILLPMDLDQDGRTDLLCVTSINGATLAYAGIAGPDGVLQPWKRWGGDAALGVLDISTCESTTVGDFNGDGIPDFACLVNGGNPGIAASIWVALGSRTALGSWSKWTDINAPAVGGMQAQIGCTSVLTADISGDGKGDLVCFYAPEPGPGGAPTAPSAIRYALSLGSSFGPWKLLAGTGPNLGKCTEVAKRRITEIDLDGSGFRALVCHEEGENPLCGGADPCQYPSIPKTWISRFDGQSFSGWGLISQETSVADLGDCRFSFVTDVDGDGLQDALCLRFKNGSMVASVQFGTGSALGKWTAWGPVLGTQLDINTCVNIEAVDLNADGRVDLICFQSLANGQSRVAVAMGTAGGFAPWIFPTGVIPPDVVDARRCAFTVSDSTGLGALSATCITIADSQTPALRIVPFGVGRDILEQVANGHGNLLALRFASLNSMIYEIGSSTYPVVDLASAGLVLAESSTNDALGSWAVTKYKYAGLKAMATGEGSLGFARVDNEDVATARVVKSFYSQSPPTAGLTEKTETWTAGILIGTSENKWSILVNSMHCEAAEALAGPWKQLSSNSQTAAEREATCAIAQAQGKQIRFVSAADELAVANAIANHVRADRGLRASYLSYLKEERSLGKDLGGKVLTSDTTTYEVDPYGNVVNTTRSELDGRTTTSKSTFDIDAANNQLGLLRTSTITASLNGLTSTRGTSFRYDSKGNLIQEVLADGSSASLTREYSRDPFGNVLKLRETGADGLTRFEERLYDQEGVFAVMQQDYTGHKESFISDRLFGGRVQRIDASGRSWSWKFDIGGRQTQETNPMGNIELVRYKLCQAPITCPENISRVTVKETPNNAAVITFFDARERERYRAEAGFNGTWRVSGKRYDAAGRVLRVLEPAAVSGSHGFKQYKYDSLDRVVQVENEQGIFRKISYDGTASTYSDEKGNKETVIENSRGLPIRRESTTGKPVETTYDVWGNVVLVKLGGIPVMGAEFDDRGRVMKISSPDRGIVQYYRDGFGRIVKQLDTGGVVSFEYDLIDRLVGRMGAEGKVTWIYDQDPHAIGLLSRVLGPTMGDVEEYSYDAFGQLSKKRRMIQGAWHSFGYKYDKQGKLLETEYPSGFIVKNSYDSSGLLKNQRDGSDGALFLDVTSVSARGQIEDFLLGNSLRTRYKFDMAGRRLTEINTTRGPINKTVFGIKYTYNEVGLLAQQDDLALNSTERFEYDEARRLTFSNQLGGSTTNVEYDDFSRVVKKTGAGVLEYPVGNFSFAPARVDGKLEKRDAMGRLTEWRGGTIAIGTNGKPAEISRGGYRVRLQYDYANELLVETVSRGPGTVVTADYPLKPSGQTIRVSGIYEERRFDGRELKYHFIPGPAGLYAVVIFDRDVAKNITRRYIRYLHRDRVGSVVAISAENGDLVERRRFDPWGVSRPVTQAGVITGAFLPIDQSYAGHSAMRDFGLIYAGGRLYDPAKGLFTSPDVVSAIGTSFHEYNPYGYAAFNPLSAVDPYGLLSFGEVLGGVAGFFVGGPVGAAIGFGLAHEAERNEGLRTAITIGVAVVITVGTGGAASVGEAMLFGMAAGAGAGATYTVLSGGSAEDVLRSAALGAVVGGFSGMAGYGIAQGSVLINRASDRFVAGAFTVGARGVTGGLTNQALSGDFKHGFEQAAFFAAVTEVGSAVYRGTMQEQTTNGKSNGKPPSDYDTFKDGSPHLSDVATGPADPYKASNEAGVALVNDQPSYRANNWGGARGVGGPIVEGDAWSNFISKIPGQNPAAYIHDSWMANYPNFAGLGLTNTWSQAFVLSMPLAGIVTYSAMAHEIYTIRNQALWGCRKTRQQFGGAASC